jgi:hypothetical protein
MGIGIKGMGMGMGWRSGRAKRRWEETRGSFPPASQEGG